jgi:hypothetical protein
MIELNETYPTIKSFVGELEVIGNGIVPALTEAKLRLAVNELQFEFEFVVDKEHTGFKVERKVIEKKLTFILTNFENSLGSGILNPLEIGHLNSKRLYISFWVWTPNLTEGIRLINWTMLKGGDIIINTEENE